MLDRASGTNGITLTRNMRGSGWVFTLCKVRLSIIALPITFTHIEPSLTYSCIDGLSADKRRFTPSEFKPCPPNQETLRMKFMRYASLLLSVSVVAIAGCKGAGGWGKGFSMPP